MAATTIRKGVSVVLIPGTRIWRDSTPEDRRAWEASPASKGMTDGGDTKLMSPSQYGKSVPGRTYSVARARVAARIGWSTQSGCAVVQDTDGSEWYVSRKHILVLA